MNIEIFLRFCTRPGQRLKVVGNVPVMGNSVSSAALPLNYYNDQYWSASIELKSDSYKESELFRYHYLLQEDNGECNEDWGRNRGLPFSELSNGCCIVDTWVDVGAIQNNFYTTPFKSIFQPKRSFTKRTPIASGTVRLEVDAPLLDERADVVVTGNHPMLGNWLQSDPLPMIFDGVKWFVDLPLNDFENGFEYKYCIRTGLSPAYRYEQGQNRSFSSVSLHQSNSYLVRDGFINEVPNWKGAGLAIPVFSLRSNNSWGVGEFSDIMQLSDWASSVSLRLIQLLPVNDTTSTHTRLDSYPYAAISAFALHPLYISIPQIAGKQFASLITDYIERAEALNVQAEVDYEGVMELKWEVLHILYDAMKVEVFKRTAYKEFFNENSSWLVPYALYSHLRDTHGTHRWDTWGSHSVFSRKLMNDLLEEDESVIDRISIHFFIQYFLHEQLKAAHDYANQKGIVLKGDIAIGVHRYGADTWTQPDLYHLTKQAGAPPDDFAVSGQNWGFPTYNWARMKADGYAWWKQRFLQMASYFDAFRIDHILGFFRIWSIPDHAVEGIMGRFYPAQPVMEHEFLTAHCWHGEERFCTPFITESLLNEQDARIREKLLHFVEQRPFGTYHLLPEFSTQQKVEQYFSALSDTIEHRQLKQALFHLISNVILWKDEAIEKGYHFRFNAHKTASFKALDLETQHRLMGLYNDYFYHRQDDLWKKEGMEKLPALKKCTKMLICGEDLGMVPRSVPEVMSNMGLLSMEVQRMPKSSGSDFFDPTHAPYLSVVTPSTHDMSTIREWWTENKTLTAKFYHHELHLQGDPPTQACGKIVQSIISQHLESPAMWAIFQLQDLMGMDESIRVKDPLTERINIPGDAKHYWRYRMHISLEELLINLSFNSQLKEMIASSSRSC